MFSEHAYLSLSKNYIRDLAKVIRTHRKHTYNTRVATRDVKKRYHLMLKTLGLSVDVFEDFMIDAVLDEL